MIKKFTSTIAGASIFISVIGLFSRGLGFIREMIFANNFGLETEFDLYLVGAVLPITINSIVLYIAQNYFVPGFQKKKSEDDISAKDFYKKSFILFVCIGTLIALLLFFLSDIIIDSYMNLASDESKEMALVIFRVFLITIPFSAAISVFTALLQAVFEFRFPAISILFLNISVILLLILFSEEFGVFIIPIGYAIGTALQFLYLLYNSQKVVRLNLFNGNSTYNFSRSIVGTSLMTIILIESLSQLYPLFDRYFYADLTEGGIAALNYAFIIWIQPIAILSLSLSTAVFPKISQAISDLSREQVERIYNENISVSTFIFLPIAFIMFFYGDVLIAILFERGKFVEESTLITFSVLKLYVLSLVFYSVYAVFNKIFYSMNKIKLLFWVTLFGIIIKLSLNFILIDYGQNGLALSTSISYIFFFLVTLLILNVQLKIKNRTLFLKEFFTHLINCILCFLVVQLISSIFSFKDILADVILILIFISVYAVTSIILNHQAMVIFNRVFRNMKNDDKLEPI